MRWLCPRSSCGPEGRCVSSRAGQIESASAGPQRIAVKPDIWVGGVSAVRLFMIDLLGVKLSLDVGEVLEPWLCLGLSCGITIKSYSSRIIS